MRSSSLALLGSALVLVVTASGCRIEVHTQTQFEDSTQPAKTSIKDWSGEAISITSDGINPLGGTGGVEVKFSNSATKITAEAVFAAHADDDKKADADASILDAISTLVIEETGSAFNVKCGHGGSHGTSNVAGSGCKILRVTIPSGDATQPHTLTVGAGNGAIRVGLAEAGDIPTIKTLLVDNNGLGDVDIRTRTAPDGSITVTGERAVQVSLPTDFSAKQVTFTVDESDPAKAAARIITAFDGMASGSSYPVAGATAGAITSLNVQSKGPFSDDTVTITKF